MSDDITALHVTSEENHSEQLRETWAEKVEKPVREAKSAVPRLEIIRSPYRHIYEPILKFVRKAEKENPDRLIAVIIPELVEPHCMNICFTTFTVWACARSCFCKATGAQW